MENEIKHHIYCDGGARPNPGKAGFGVVELNDKELVSAHMETYEYSTNNIMELKAFYKALQIAAQYYPKECIIYIDSAYAMNCILSWAFTWKLNGWRTSKNEPVMNKELIEEIYSYYIKNFSFFQPKVEKIRGHKGIIGNELVDALSRNNMKDFEKIITQNKLLVSCAVEKVENTDKPSSEN